jgi:hypothetical protein
VRQSSSGKSEHRRDRMIVDCPHGLVLASEEIPSTVFGPHSLPLVVAPVELRNTQRRARLSIDRVIGRSSRRR